MENFHLKNNSVGRWINHTIHVRHEISSLDTPTTVAEMLNMVGRQEDTGMAGNFINMCLRWKLQSE